MYKLKTMETAEGRLKKNKKKGLRMCEMLCVEYIQYMSNSSERNPECGYDL